MGFSEKFGFDGTGVFFQEALIGAYVDWEAKLSLHDPGWVDPMGGR